MKMIQRIERAAPAIKKRLRVAAYARVSVASERMQHSLSAQVSYYSARIQKHPEWEYAGVYADYGISGTGTAKREAFQEMLAACEAGRIDLVLTKSIQRFARNTVDLLQTVRRLKELGIEVYFEKENIRTLSGEGELLLTILASFAQEESRSISENIKWRVKKRFEQGIPNGRFRIYGYRWEGDTLVIVPEEAAIVRRIFQNFLDGKSRLETEREFAAEGITTRSGCRWVDAPSIYGPRKTLYNRFVRWADKGIWQNIFHALASAGGPPAQVLIDSSAVKAHRCAAGGKGGNGRRRLVTRGAVAARRSTP